MKVKELKEILNDLPEEYDEREVVLSTDEEGNGFSYLRNVDDFEFLLFDGEYRGEIGYSKITPELEKQGYTEEDIMENGIPCVILWP